MWDIVIAFLSSDWLWVPALGSFRVLLPPYWLPSFSCGLWSKTVQVMIKGSQKHASTEGKIAKQIERAIVILLDERKNKGK